jgi:hypothetical protein
VRVPAHHVRLSIWSGDRALFAVSIPDDEAESLATFLAAEVGDGELGDGEDRNAPTTSPAS